LKLPEMFDTSCPCFFFGFSYFLFIFYGFFVVVLMMVGFDVPVALPQL